MLKGFVSFATAAFLLTGVAVGQTPSAAQQAKERVCKQEVKAKNIVDKAAKTAYMKTCMAS